MLSNYRKPARLCAVEKADDRQKGQGHVHGPALFGANYQLPVTNYQLLFEVDAEFLDVRHGPQMQHGALADLAHALGAHAPLGGDGSADALADPPYREGTKARAALRVITIGGLD